MKRLLPCLPTSAAFVVILAQLCEQPLKMARLAWIDVAHRLDSSSEFLSQSPCIPRAHSAEIAVTDSADGGQHRLLDLSPCRPPHRKAIIHRYTTHRLRLAVRH